MNAVNRFELPGLDVDLHEGWPKLTRHQFPEPERAPAELIQNGLDAYASDTAWADRWIKLETQSNSFSVIDFGEGMSRERIRLLLTLGGTDKVGDTSKLGRFGIGFFACFHPALKTKRVVITTRCEGASIEVTFEVGESDEPPAVSTRILPETLKFGTRVDLCFRKACSVTRCVEYARRVLYFHRCQASIDGQSVETIWGDATHSGARFFSVDGTDGFIAQGNGNVTVLCKYERVLRTTINHLCAARDAYDDLRDHWRRDMPYVCGVEVVCNSNNLNPVISRDGVWMDWGYDRMVRAVATALATELLGRFGDEPPSEFVVANQYTLRDKLAPYLESAREGTTEARNDPLSVVVRRIAEAPVYRLAGRRGRFSLLDIQQMRSDDTPLFFSPRHGNLRWLGGAFKRDFTVLPPPRPVEGRGIPEFWDTVFGRLFDDVVNLDTIRDDLPKIRALVERGIVDPVAFTPKCRVIGERRLTDDECRLLGELKLILEHPQVLAAIAQRLLLCPTDIEPVFFDVEESGITLATGLLDRDGDPVGLGHTSVDDEAARTADAKREVLLTLRRDHPFIQRLVESSNPSRGYFGLMFLAHELAACQDRLAPGSRFFHWTKDQLADDMRRALMRELLARNEITRPPDASDNPESGR